MKKIQNQNEVAEVIEKNLFKAFSSIKRVKRQFPKKYPKKESKLQIFLYGIEGYKDKLHCMKFFIPVLIEIYQRKEKKRYDAEFIKYDAKLKALT